MINDPYLKGDMSITKLFLKCIFMYKLIKSDIVNHIFLVLFDTI